MLTQKLHTILQQLEPNFMSSNYLLAVSGGRDSVALAHLLAQNKIKFSIAYCNFQLRGEESNQEEKFVKELSHTLKIPFLSKQFDTENFAQSQKISIQEAARNLRYQWFFELIKTENFTKLITAHHANDDVETFFINLQRGSGLKGLAGIPDNNEKVLRPLLRVSRQEIDAYLIQNCIAYKDDSSNSYDKYLRNSIRLNLVPYLEQNFVEILNGIQATLPILKENKTLFESLVNEKKNQLFHKSENATTLSIKELLANAQPKELLYELLQEFGFNKATVNAVFDSFKITETKHYDSENYTLTKNRNDLVIAKKKIEQSVLTEFSISEEDTKIHFPLNLNFSKVDASEVNLKNIDLKIQHLDFDKIQFPLVLRQAKTGDKFKPLGMKGFKKLSDFFIDSKFSEQQKQNTWLLVSNQTIVSVIGYRINDDYKLENSSKTTYKIELL